jgi:Fe-S-cluster containining protein
MDASPRITLRVLGEEIFAQTTVPADTGRLDQLLPLLWQVDQAAIDVAARKNTRGKPIACAKGCSACCRAQPVPITPPEAYAIALLVEALPQPRQSEIRSRFIDRTTSLRQAGLYQKFFRQEKFDNPDDARRAVKDYFALGLVCPFLDDDACSIHPVRPFVCRQYLVTSDPALCRDPLNQPVEVVPIPLRPAHAMLAVTEASVGLPAETVPLVLALDYVERHRSSLEKQVPMRTALQQWLDRLTHAGSP